MFKKTIKNGTQKNAFHFFYNKFDYGYYFKNNCLLKYEFDNYFEKPYTFVH